jgi:hypothetical protein
MGNQSPPSQKGPELLAAARQAAQRQRLTELADHISLKFSLCSFRELPHCQLLGPTQPHRLRPPPTNTSSATTTTTNDNPCSWRASRASRKATKTRTRNRSFGYVPLQATVVPLHDTRISGLPLASPC